MTPKEKEIIREKARQKLLKVWEYRGEWLSNDLDEFQVLRAAPDVIVTKILNYQLEKVDEINPEADGLETAGFVDRRLGKIVISKRQEFVTQRYTLAHEIAHAVLHPNQLYHRDRPNDGSNYREYRKSMVEQEADLFAAELLMPIRLLTSVFVGCFNGRIDRADIDNDFRFNLNMATRERLSVDQLSRLRARDLSMKFASIASFGQTLFEPLDKRFGVSRTAMAIQLTEYGLVM